MPDYLDMLATRVVALVLQLPVVELVAEVLREWLNISVGWDKDAGRGDNGGYAIGDGQWLGDSKGDNGSSNDGDDSRGGDLNDQAKVVLEAPQVVLGEVL